MMKRRASNRSFGLSVLQTGYLSSLAPAWARFAWAASNPERAQSRRLEAILCANQGTAFGRAKGFSTIDSLNAYRAKVPICSFEEIAPWVERAAKGEERVLTHEPVRMMEPTSGSTSANKLIPFTAGFLKEMAAATHPWLFDLMRSCPGLFGTRSYWALSPATRARETTAGGIPIGIEDDTEYFGPLAKWALEEMMAVPSRVGRIHDIDRWRWETCRHLLQAENLGLISVWSPTFFTRMMETIERDLDDLLACLTADRAARIRRAIDHDHGVLTASCLWPSLAVLSCWADGPSQGFLPALRRYFPKTRLQPKGLLATEGVVSFPLWNVEGSVLAVAGHFLEFLDLENEARPPLLAHELREGMVVSPVLTTSGGLYRYHLRDQVQCVGRYRATPCVRFMGRLDSVSDLVGEKLDEQVVGRAIERASLTVDARWSFAMLAPEEGWPPSYRLYLEGPFNEEKAESMAKEVEIALLEGVHYAYCRKMGQLGPIRPVLVSCAVSALERRRSFEGLRIGQMKPSPLDRRTGWADFFSDL